MQRWVKRAPGAFGASAQWAKQGDEETGCHGWRRVAGARSWFFCHISCLSGVHTEMSVTSSVMGLDLG